MATRERDRVEGPETATVERYVNGSQTNSYVTTEKQSYELIHDVVTENFHARVAKGEIINNPVDYTKTYVEADADKGSSSWTVSGKTYAMYGSGSLTHGMRERLKSLNAPSGQFMNNDPAPITAMTADAKSKCLGYLDRSPYSFAEDIAEWRETLRFLKSPFQSFRKLGKTFDKELKKKLKDQKRSKSDPNKRNYRDTAESINEAISVFDDLWLEYRFAVSPLIRSANDAIESMFVKARRPERQTARGIVTHLDEVKNDIQYTSNGALTWVRNKRTESVVKAGVLYVISNPVEDWRYKYGLRFKDIPETLWAIMPYSFMVDRVINISQTVRGMTAYLDPSLTFLAAWVSEKTNKMSSLSFVDYNVANMTAKSIDPDTIYDNSAYYGREVWNPSIGDAVPTVNVGNLLSETTYVLDLLTLGHSNFSLKGKS